MVRIQPLSSTPLSLVTHLPLPPAYTHLPLPPPPLLSPPPRRFVVIRTKNKKYFKKLAIPDLDRFSLPYLSTSVSFAYANNTLIVTYEKPPEILKFEESIRNEIKKMRGMDEGDVEPCIPS